MKKAEDLKWWGWGEAGVSYPIDLELVLLPAMEDILGCKLDKKFLPVTIDDIQLRPSKIPREDINKLEKSVGKEKIRNEKLLRITHSLGKSYKDLIRLRTGAAFNSVDYVCYPETETDILKILQWCNISKVAVIPYGGGSSVVGGLEVSANSKYNGHISLDLSRMNKLLHLDTVSLLANIQAGIMGPDLERELNRAGMTLMHFPQSFEFSSLGGWIATRSAGQNSTKYGKIEHMVNGFNIITPEEVFSTDLSPASATGPGLKEFYMGSEGLLGIFSSAWMQIKRIPENERFTGLLFKSFSDGMEFCRNLIQNNIVPSCLRLSDETETRVFGKLALSKSGKLGSILYSLLKKIPQNFLRNNYSLVILSFDGTEKEINLEMKKMKGVASGFKGIVLGEHFGKAWVKERFTLPYLRDDLITLGILVDTFETATNWENVPLLYKNVNQAINDLFDKNGLKGRLMCHLSHFYTSGASLYFTVFCKVSPREELELWKLIKIVISDTITKSNGVISHHHGIGIDHKPWLGSIMSDSTKFALNTLKKSLDPQFIMNPGKLFN